MQLGQIAKSLSDKQYSGLYPSMKLGYYYITPSVDIALLRRIIIIFTKYQNSTMSKRDDYTIKICSKTRSLKQEIRSLLHNSILRHLPYTQALSMPNCKPLSPTAKSRSDNYTNLNQKNQSRTCSLKQEIRSLLRNDTLGHLPYLQALSMPNFRPLSPIAKSQSDNYTNLNKKIQSKTCSLKQ